MALPTNTLQQVITYQESSLAYLQNACCFINEANTKFKDFENREANLGSSITFDLPPRYTTADSLIATFQPSTQRIQTLTASQSANTSYAFSAQQFIFNVEQYMEQFGKSAVQELASKVEIDVAKNAISGVRNQLTGSLQTDSGPYRFFGDGETAINNYQQLAQMIANFKNYGSVQTGIKVFLPDTIIPAIIGSGLNQFAPERNNKDAMSWELGSFGAPPVDYYQSNLLPIQIAGTVGNEAVVADRQLTVVSTNDPTGQNITQITLSGATASDLDAIKSGDLGQFVDNVSSFNNLRFLTFIGHNPSAQPVQIRVTADAEANVSGNVTISITPALVSAAGATQNLNYAIEAGMKIQFMPSHRAGVVIGGEALFLAMPKLPPVPPFDSSSKSDSNTGVSMRMYYGSLFGQNQQGFVNDVLWGSTLVPEYSMRILFRV
jgi:hypothetical protein